MNLQTQEQILYTAGFMERGSYCISKRKMPGGFKYLPMVRVVANSKVLMEWLKETWGFATEFQTPTSWRAALEGKQALHLVMLIRPYLIQKAQHAAIFYRYNQLMLGKHSYKTTADLKIAVQSIHFEMDELNREQNRQYRNKTDNQKKAKILEKEGLHHESVALDKEEGVFSFADKLSGLLKTTDQYEEPEMVNEEKTVKPKAWPSIFDRLT